MLKSIGAKERSEKRNSEADIRLFRIDERYGMMGFTSDKVDFYLFV